MQQNRRRTSTKVAHPQRSSQAHPGLSPSSQLPSSPHLHGRPVERKLQSKPEAPEEQRQISPNLPASDPGESRPSLFEGSGQEIRRSSPGRHAHATSETSQTRPSPPLGDADGDPPGELAPNSNTKKKPKLQTVQRGRTPPLPVTPAGQAAGGGGEGGRQAADDFQGERWERRGAWFGRQSSGRIDGSGNVGAKKMELAVEKDGRKFGCERHGDRV
jgi:hypothetical protein